MRCPRCNRVVPENAPSCPACGEDLVLEPLGEVDMLWEDTPAEGAVPEMLTSARSTAELSAEQARQLQQAAPPPAGGPPQPARPAFGEGLQANISTKIVEADPERDRHTRIVEVSVPAVVRRAASESPAAPPQPGRGARQTPSDAAMDRSIEELGDSMRMFYARMHRIDRITFWANLLAFICAFLPWRNALGEGLVSGIEGLGGASAAAAALVALCIYARTARRRLAGLVLLAQLILAAGVVAVPVYQFFYQPGLAFHVGLYGTALAGGSVIVLTFVRMAMRSF